MERKRNQSLLMLIASMLIFGSIGIFRRYIPLPSAGLACFRGFCGALFILVLAKVQKRKIIGQTGGKTLVWLIVSGAMIGINWILLFEAYNYTTVATATLCYYMQPTIVMLVSPLLFRERLNLRKILCIAVSFAGMVLVSGMAENGLPELSEMKGIFFGLGAAVFYSMVVILNKKVSGVDSYEKTMIQLTSAAVCLLPYLLLAGQTDVPALSATAVLMLLIVGFIHTGVAYWFYFGSMENLKAQTVAVLGYLDPITALILSAVILHEKMTVFGIVGAAMIIGAAIFSEAGMGKSRAS